MKPIDQEAVDRAIKVLNEMLECDPRATNELFLKHRVKCNAGLAVHETIQAGLTSKDPQEFDIGILGVINGLFGIRKDRNGPICVSVEPPEKGGGIHCFKPTPESEICIQCSVLFYLEKEKECFYCAGKLCDYCGIVLEEGKDMDCCKACYSENEMAQE
jgi:hypothetical protein